MFLFTWEATHQWTSMVEKKCSLMVDEYDLAFFFFALILAGFTVRQQCAFVYLYLFWFDLLFTNLDFQLYCLFSQHKTFRISGFCFILALNSLHVHVSTNCCLSVSIHTSSVHMHPSVPIQRHLPPKNPIIFVSFRAHFPWHEFKTCSWIMKHCSLMTQK